MKSRRSLDDAGLAAVDDGRVFTGRQSIGLHLVDALGEERDALKYLQDAKGVSKSLPVLDWKKDGGFSGLRLFSAVAGLASLCGLDGLAGTIEATGHLADARVLNGPLFLWDLH